MNLTRLFSPHDSSVDDVMVMQTCLPLSKKEFNAMLPTGPEQTFRKKASTPLTWSLLRDAQERVLGERKPGFRTEYAFAKGGRERYGLDAKTRTEIEKRLSEPNDSAISLQARAARVYLDICFFFTPYTSGILKWLGDFIIQLAHLSDR